MFKSLLNLTKLKCYEQLTALILMWHFCTNAYEILRWIMGSSTPGLCKTQEPPFVYTSRCCNLETIKFFSPMSMCTYFFSFLAPSPLRIKFNDLIFNFQKLHIKRGKLNCIRRFSMRECNAYCFP